MRYTPPKPKEKSVTLDKIEALRREWAEVDPGDPRLTTHGKVLAIAARLDIDRFRQVCRDLTGEEGATGGEGG